MNAISPATGEGARESARWGVSFLVVCALHLAAAQLSGCTELWTNDKRLAAASHGLAVDILDR